MKNTKISNFRREVPCRLHLRTAALLLFATGLLVTGCSEHDGETSDDDGNRPVKILPRASLTNVTVESLSKSIDGLDQALTFHFVRVDQNSDDSYGSYGDEFSGTRAAGTGSTEVAFSPVQYYQTNGKNTRIAGWYPGAASADSGDGHYDASAGAVSWTIDGGQDILLAAPREGSKTAAMPAFEFKHALAQLQLHFYADSEVAVGQWGKILGVAVRGQRTAAAFTPVDATDDNLSLSFTGDATETFAAANFAELTAPVGTKDNAAAGGDPVMIEPQEDASQLTVEITTEKRGLQTAVVPERAYVAGQAVKICIRLSEQSVTIDPDGCEITPWSNVIQTEDNEIDSGNKL